MSQVEIEVPAAAEHGQHGVYVLFDADDEPIYIGRSSNLFLRLTQHRRDKPWWRQVRRLEWTPCAGAVEARVVERDLIAAFHPDANINDAIPVKTGRTGPLPWWAARHLRNLYEASEGRGTPSDDRLNAYIKALRHAGWAGTTVGHPLGFTREAIRLREMRAVPVQGLPPVPAIPVQAKPVKPPKPRLPEATVARLRRLHAQCRGLNGSVPADSPMRTASVELSELIASLVIEGWSRYAVAKALGISHFAVTARLARHGYMDPAPSQVGQSYKGQPGYTSRRHDRCKWGHELSGANLYLVGGDPSRRVCRACDRRRGDEYRARRARMAGAS